MRISEMNETLKIQDGFFNRAIREMCASDCRTGKVSFFEEAFFKPGLFQFGVFKTHSREVAKKKDTARQISLFKFARSEREFLGGKIVCSRAFFKNAILHNSAGEITIREFDGQKVQIAQLAFRKSATGKTGAFAVHRRKIASSECASVKSGEFEIYSREHTSRKLTIRKMLTPNFFFRKNFMFIMHRA